MAQPPGLRDSALRKISNPVLSDEVTFTQYAREIPGKPWTECLVTVQPGGGTPLHYHTNYTETFTARSGGLGVVLDGVDRLLADGESALVNIGHVHRFHNPTDKPIEFHVRIDGVGGTEEEKIEQAEGFEKVLYVVYGLAHEGGLMSDGVPRNPLHLAVACELGNTLLPGVQGWIISPFLGSLGMIAGLLGTKKALVERFWDNWEGRDKT